MQKNKPGSCRENFRLFLNGTILPIVEHSLRLHRRLFGHFSRQTSYLFSASALHTCYEIPTPPSFALIIRSAVPMERAEELLNYS